LSPGDESCQARSPPGERLSLRSPPGGGRFEIARRRASRPDRSRRRGVQQIEPRTSDAGPVRMGRQSPQIDDGSFDASCRRDGARVELGRQEQHPHSELRAEAELGSELQQSAHPGLHPGALSQAVRERPQVGPPVGQEHQAPLDLAGPWRRSRFANRGRGSARRRSRGGRRASGEGCAAAEAAASAPGAPGRSLRHGPALDRRPLASRWRPPLCRRRRAAAGRRRQGRGLPSTAGG